MTAMILLVPTRPRGNGLGKSIGDDKIVSLTDRTLKLPPGPLGVGPGDGFSRELLPNGQRQITRIAKHSPVFVARRLGNVSAGLPDADEDADSVPGDAEGE